MYNMQAVIRKSINNATQQFERLGYVGNNLANYNTRGYKSVRFEQMLKEDGYITGAVRMNSAQGSIRVSANPYDIAIDGDGYIPVTSPDGEVQYTRDGMLKKGKGGYLMTADDWIVGDGIKLPPNCYKFQICPNGDVYSYDEAGSLPSKVGTIPIVTFDCTEALEQGASNKMVTTEESGQARIVKGHTSIRQNAEEMSNMDVYEEINSMLRLNASMIASMRLMKVADDMYNKAINIRE